MINNSCIRAIYANKGFRLKELNKITTKDQRFTKEIIPAL